MIKKFTQAVVALAAASTLVLVGCGGGSKEENGSGSTTLNVALPNHVWTEAIKKRIPEFESTSGLKVNLTTFGEDQLSDQYNVKLNTRSSDFDVMMFRPLQEGKLFADNGWLTKLDDDIKGASGWNWADFQPAPVSAVTAEDKSVYGVPLVTEREILYYNSELLKAKGIGVPKTLDELKKAAAELHDPGNGVYGFVARGQRAPAVTQFSSFLYSFGGDFAQDGKASLDTAAAQQAYEFYGTMLREYGPPGTTEMSWPQALPIFAQGKAAFYTDADSLYANFNDPTKSKVSKTIGFAQFPAGPAGSKPYNIPSWALGINEFSENKDNAWKFLEWATSAETSLSVQGDDGVPLARASVWNDPKGSAGFPQQLAAVIKSSSEVGVDHDRPQVIKVSEARDIVGGPIVESIQGQDVGAGLAKAQTDFQSFLEDENR